MNSQEYMNLGRLGDALAALQAEIRARPEDARLRIFLFQLLSVLGQWDRALTQLNVLADLDANGMMLAKIFTPQTPRPRSNSGSVNAARYSESYAPLSCVFD